MDQNIFDEEQQHLSLVYGELENTNRHLEAQIEELNTTAKEDKKDILTNLRYDVADDEVTLESYGEIETWNRYIDTYNINSDTFSSKLKEVKILLDAPYFAHIRLRYDPNEEPEDYYIGRGAFSVNTCEPLIIDWRSPIAETYYNQDNGETSYEVEGRKIPVELLLRRQFDLKKDHLFAYFDTSLAIEDPLLLQSLSKRHTDHLQDITVTIQKEQNAVIRHKEEPVLLVNGIAGSGKTSVLLQRIAYLFYQKRNSLRPENVVLMTLNPVFQQYIEDVLPDLGEKNPVTMTWIEFLHHVHDPINDPGLGTKENSLEVIEETLPDLTLEEEDLVPVTQKGQIIVGTDRILAVLQKHMGLLPTGERLIQVVADELADEARQNLKKARRKQKEEQEEEESEEQEYGNEEDLQEEQEAFQDEEQLDEDEEKERQEYENDKKSHELGKGYGEQAQDNQLQNDYGGAFKMIRECGWLNIDHIGQRILNRKLSSIEWFYLKMLLTGECDRTTEYVCIDEIQDYTASQIRTLAKYYRNAKFLLLGDEYQSIRQGTVSFQGIHRLFQSTGKDVTELSLETSYRSTPEITALFSLLLPKEKQLHASSVQREGTAPFIRSFDSRKSYEHELIKEVQEAKKQEGVTAILCSDKNHVAEVQKILSDHQEEIQGVIPIVGGTTHLVSSGVCLIALSNAKGLEFDHVILPDATSSVYGEDELSRHRLYTAISRATQSISILACGELTPLLKGYVDET